MTRNSNRNSSSRTTDRFETPTQYLELPYCDLAYYRFGRGPDLVFVHGWPLHAATYRAFVEQLEDRFTCHLFDLPGTGNTRWTEQTPIGLWEHANTVKMALDMLDLERYALVAHDSGGTIARLLIALDKSRCVGLAMTNTEIPGHVLPMLQAVGTVNKLPGVRPAFRQMLGSRRFLRSRWGFKGCFEDVDFMDGEFHDLFIAPLVKDRRAFEGQMGLVDGLNWGVVMELGKIHEGIEVPVQLVWGDRDYAFFPLKEARGMVDSFGGPCELHVIEGARLFVHEEYPERVVAHHAPFLEACFLEERAVQHAPSAG